MSDLTNVIEVTFGSSTIAVVKGTFAYKHNVGIILMPTDIDLPDTYQVHWALSPDAPTSLESIGTAEGGVLIPDEMWESNNGFCAWFYLHPTDDSSVTVYEVRILARRRAGLPDGTEPTPQELSTIDQAIAALNNAVEQTASDVATATAQAQAALDSAADAEGFADVAQASAASAESFAAAAASSASSASDDADRAEQAASEAAGAASTASTAAISAQGYAEDAEESAERAEMAANNAGFFVVELDARDHLIYTRTDDVDVDFSITDTGHLIMEA